MTEATETEWLNAISAAIFIVQNDCIAFANQAAGNLAGYSPHELSGIAYANLFQRSKDWPIHTCYVVTEARLPSN